MYVFCTLLLANVGLVWVMWFVCGLLLFEFACLNVCWVGGYLVLLCLRCGLRNLVCA